ncbi:MAG TPA: cytochrome c [Solirubrobacterales bacterium]|nr:cytochrome c [Solirubrobacterales bacterium]
MSKAPIVIFGIFAAICVLAIPFLALASKGGEDAATVEVEPRDGEARDLFVTSCGQCHTLAAARTNGVVAPNLDDLLVPTGTNSPDLYEGIYTRVLNAVTCGLGGRMPAGILVGENAKEVSQFVAAYAGQIDRGPTVDTSEAETPDSGGC